MQDLEIELCLALQRHQPHGRPRRRLGDRLRATVVGLLRLHVRLDILRRHQPHLVALRLERPPEEVRPAAGLHRHDADRQLCDEAITPSRVIRLRSTTAPLASRAARLQLFLPRSIPSTATGVLVMVGSSSVRREPAPVVRGVGQVSVPDLRRGDVVIMDMCGRPRGSKHNLRSGWCADRVLTCVRPLCGHDMPRARMGVRGSGPKQPGALGWRLSMNWLTRPRLTTVAPYSPSTSACPTAPHEPDGYAATAGAR